MQFLDETQEGDKCLGVSAKQIIATKNCSFKFLQTVLVQATGRLYE